MPDTPDSTGPRTVLAFDFGLRRIGVAVGQRITHSASPLGIVANGAAGPDWRHVEKLIDEWQPAELIVGMPLHADGSPSDIGRPVEAFISALGRFGLPVATVDERYSSLEVRERMVAGRAAGTTKRIRKEMIDAAAAVLIAERWLGA